MALTHYKRTPCQAGNEYHFGTTLTRSNFVSGFKGANAHLGYRFQGTSETNQRGNNLEGCITTRTISGRTFAVRKWEEYTKVSFYTYTSRNDDGEEVTTEATRKKVCASSKKVDSYDNGQQRETHTYNDSDGNAQETVKKTLDNNSAGGCVTSQKFVRNKPTDWSPDYSHVLDPNATESVKLTGEQECELLTTKHPNPEIPGDQFYTTYEKTTYPPCPSSTTRQKQKFIDSADNASYKFGSFEGCWKLCRTDVGYDNDVEIHIRGDTEELERKDFKSNMFFTLIAKDEGGIIEKCSDSTGRRFPSNFQEFAYLGASMKQTRSTFADEQIISLPLGKSWVTSDFTRKSVVTYTRQGVERGEFVDYHSFEIPEIDYDESTTKRRKGIQNTIKETKTVYKSNGESATIGVTTIEQTYWTHTEYGTSMKSYNTDMDSPQTAEGEDDEGLPITKTTGTNWARASVASFSGIDFFSEFKTTLFKIRHKGLEHEIVNYDEDGNVTTPATIPYTTHLPALVTARGITAVKGNGYAAELGPPLQPCGNELGTVAYVNYDTNLRHEYGVSHVAANNYEDYSHHIEAEINTEQGGGLIFYAYQARDYYTTGFQRISDVGRDGRKWNSMSTPLDLKSDQTLSALPDLTAFRTIVSDIGYSAVTTTSNNGLFARTSIVDNKPLSNTTIISPFEQKSTQEILDFHSLMTELSFGVSNEVSFTEYDCEVETFKTKNNSEQDTFAYSFKRKVDTTGTKIMEDDPNGKAVIHHSFGYIDVNEHFAIGGLDQNGEPRSFYLCAHFLGSVNSATLQGTYHSECESYTTELDLRDGVLTITGEIPTVYVSNQMIAVSDAINLLGGESIRVASDNVSKYI